MGEAKHAKKLAAIQREEALRAKVGYKKEYAATMQAFIPWGLCVCSRIQFFYRPTRRRVFFVSIYWSSLEDHGPLDDTL